eukprot:gene8761-biopygen16657
MRRGKRAGQRECVSGFTIPGKVRGGCTEDAPRMHRGCTEDAQEQQQGYTRLHFSGNLEIVPNGGVLPSNLSTPSPGVPLCCTERACPNTCTVATRYPLLWMSCGCIRMDPMGGFVSIPMLPGQFSRLAVGEMIPPRRPPGAPPPRWWRCAQRQRTTTVGAGRMRAARAARERSALCPDVVCVAFPSACGGNSAFRAVVA